MDDLDALLADLESTTSHISKRPVFLPDETPYSIPTGGLPYQDVSRPPPVPPPPSADALNGSLTDQPDSHHSSQQSLGSAQKNSWSRDSSSSPLSHIEEDHVYSFPNKHKTSDSSSAAMSSALGSNLSELDRLLLELNAVQQSSPSFPTTEEAAPPLPSCSITHYENGGAPDILVSPPPQEKPKRNGIRAEDVGGLLEGSGPSPSSSSGHNDLDASSQQQSRMSASCATRELDELMASLSDFKPASLGSLSDPAGTPAPSSFPPAASSSLGLPPPASCFLPLSAALELHINEEGPACGSATPQSGLLVPNSPTSSLSAASDADLDSVLDASASLLSSKTRSLLALSQSAPSNSSLSNTTTPSLTSVNTVLERKTPKSPSPSAERLSPSVVKRFGPSDSSCLRPACFLDRDLDFTSQTLSKTFTPPPSALSPLPAAVSPLTTPSPLVFTSTSRQLSEVPPAEQRGAPLALQPPSAAEPSLDEALDKLLAMSLAQTQASDVEEPLEKMEDHSPRGLQEELILPMDRSCVQPDTFTSTTNTITDDSIDMGTDGNGDLDWADEELSLLLHDGLDGTVTPFTERLYTDGSMTSLTEASWMDESITPYSCPGTPDVPLELLQAPSVDRVSATGHIKSVIRRTKETPNVHPMYRDGHLRRKMGPIIVNKNSSQDRLIEELQGKLGINRPERRRKQSDEWLTDGVVLTSKPQRLRPDGSAGEIVLPPDSPIPSRKVLPPLSPPNLRRPPVLEEPKRALPVQQHPVPIPPPPPPPSSFTSQRTLPQEQRPLPQQVTKAPPPPAPLQEAPKPEPCPPIVSTPNNPPPVEPVQPAAPKVLVSVGCQTESDLFFPPMQILAQGKAGPPGGPPTQVNKLDNMLGSLQSDLNKLGVQTAAKGVCGACCKPIVGQVVTAMGRTWHPEHFVCTHCQEEIGSRNFFEREGQPYCEKDYHHLFSPRCYYCNGPILDKVVTALDRTWHPEHFFCAQCGSFFGPEGFHEKDGKAYCRKDYFDMFAPKCGGCARAILENYISALNCLWHPECFVCRECFTPFVNGSFFEHDGQPYCEVHYHERRGSLCSGCQKPITGRCITAMAKKFHPEHFVCAFCLKQLNKGTFKEQNDKPYCQGCFIKLFS
ncbi:uncharacterized protein pxnb isoform X2 [Cyprinodon tularosa]|uniref:uncharacterized protein pxnb isoform X2 n=1 Tax=Cyprinodon tularosa TaxID=77115 RepID=UPI0018E2333E|nr:uncharacterized protein pxnb isoform X2 [Cyprinodon tularosa]